MKAPFWSLVLKSGLSSNLTLLLQTDLTQVGSIFSLVSEGGALALLIWIVIGASREWWFTKEAFHRMIKDKDAQIVKAEKDRDEWRSIALRSLNTTDKAVAQLEPPV